MSVTKITGIETEYGILIRGAPLSDPFAASRLLLSQVEDRPPPQGHPPAGDEAAVADQRVAVGDKEALAAGARRRRQDWARLDADDDDADEHGRMGPTDDMMLPNGARFYIDHGHPEYATAEAATPRGVVAADKAGEWLVRRCCRRVNAAGVLPPGQTLAVFKNNSDQHGNSYGCHENYLLAAPVFEGLMQRRLHRLLRVLAPFLVTRIVYCGAGKVGSENATSPAGFQLSQRADFYETVLGLQTTSHRPLINTRDEPHADPQWFRRLHVIAGDANLAEMSTYLKVGTTQLVLLLLEDEDIDLDLTLEDPVAAAQIVSRDLSFGEKLMLADGRQLSAVDIQAAFLAAARRYLAGHPELDHLRQVADVWEDTLQKLRGDWRALAARLDWAIKRRMMERLLGTFPCDWDAVRDWQLPIQVTLTLDNLVADDGPGPVRRALRRRAPDQARTLERYMELEGLDWADYWRQREVFFALRQMDIEYHDLAYDPATGAGGLYNRLAHKGVIERLLTDDEIRPLVDAAPDDTRAYLRGYCLTHYANLVQRADWSTIDFYDPQEDRSFTLQLPDPTVGDKAFLGQLPAVAPSLPELMRHLAQRHQAVVVPARNMRYE